MSTVRLVLGSYVALPLWSGSKLDPYDLEGVPIGRDTEQSCDLKLPFPLNSLTSPALIRIVKDEILTPTT